MAPSSPGSLSLEPHVADHDSGSTTRPSYLKNALRSCFSACGTRAITLGRAAVLKVYRASQYVAENCFQLNTLETVVKRARYYAVDRGVLQVVPFLGRLIPRKFGVAAFLISLNLEQVGLGVLFVPYSYVLGGNDVFYDGAAVDSLSVWYATVGISADADQDPIAQSFYDYTARLPNVTWHRLQSELEGSPKFHFVGFSVVVLAIVLLSIRISDRICAGAKETECSNISNAWEMVSTAQFGYAREFFLQSMYHFLLFVDCVAVACLQYTVNCCLLKEVVLAQVQDFEADYVDVGEGSAAEDGPRHGRGGGPPLEVALARSFGVIDGRVGKDGTSAGLQNHVPGELQLPSYYDLFSSGPPPLFGPVSNSTTGEVEAYASRFENYITGLWHAGAAELDGFVVLWIVGSLLVFFPFVVKNRANWLMLEVSQSYSKGERVGSAFGILAFVQRTTEVFNQFVAALQKSYRFVFHEALRFRGYCLGISLLFFSFFVNHLELPFVLRHHPVGGQVLQFAQALGLVWNLVIGVGLAQIKPDPNLLLPTSWILCRVCLIVALFFALGTNLRRLQIYLFMSAANVSKWFLVQYEKRTGARVVDVLLPVFWEEEEDQEVEQKMERGAAEARPRAARTSSADGKSGGGGGSINAFFGNRWDAMKTPLLVSSVATSESGQDVFAQSATSNSSELRATTYERGAAAPKLSVTTTPAARSSGADSFRTDAFQSVLTTGPDGGYFGADQQDHDFLNATQASSMVSRTEHEIALLRETPSLPRATGIDSVNLRGPSEPYNFMTLEALEQLVLFPRSIEIHAKKDVVNWRVVLSWFPEPDAVSTTQNRAYSTLQDLAEEKRRLELRTGVGFLENSMERGAPAGGSKRSSPFNASSPRSDDGGAFDADEFDYRGAELQLAFERDARTMPEPIFLDMNGGGAALSRGVGGGGAQQRLQTGTSGPQSAGGPQNALPNSPSAPARKGLAQYRESTGGTMNIPPSLMQPLLSSSDAVSAMRFRQPRSKAFATFMNGKKKRERDIMEYALDERTLSRQTMKALNSDIFVDNRGELDHEDMAEGPEADTGGPTTASRFEAEALAGMRRQRRGSSRRGGIGSMQPGSGSATSVIGDEHSADPASEDAASAGATPPALNGDEQTSRENSQERDERLLSVIPTDDDIKKAGSPFARARDALSQRSAVNPWNLSSALAQVRGRGPSRLVSEPDESGAHSSRPSSLYATPRRDQSRMVFRDGNAESRRRKFMNVGNNSARRASLEQSPPWSPSLEFPGGFAALPVGGASAARSSAAQVMPTYGSNSSISTAAGGGVSVTSGSVVFRQTGGTALPLARDRATIIRESGNDLFGMNLVEDVRASLLFDARARMMSGGLGARDDFVTQFFYPKPSLFAKNGVIYKLMGVLALVLVGLFSFVTIRLTRFRQLRALQMASRIHSGANSSGPRSYIEHGASSFIQDEESESLQRERAAALAQQQRQQAQTTSIIVAANNSFFLEAATLYIGEWVCTLLVAKLFVMLLIAKVVFPRIIQGTNPGNPLTLEKANISRVDLLLVLVCLVVVVY
eukprot:g14345.t1